MNNTAERKTIPN